MDDISAQLIIDAINEQTQAIHIQFAVLIAILLILNWRKRRRR